MRVLDLPGHGDSGEIFAYISVDEHGKSGICAAMTNLGLTPMVSMTRPDMDKWAPFVTELRKEGRDIRLIRYSSAEQLD